MAQETMRKSGSSVQPEEELLRYKNFVYQTIGYRERSGYFKYGGISQQVFLQLSRFGLFWCFLGYGPYVNYSIVLPYLVKLST